MRNHLVEGFRNGRLALLALVGAALLAALIPAASASSHRRTSATKNPICSRLNKTLGLSAGADMYCLGRVKSSHTTTTSNSQLKKATPKNVDSASPAEDVSPFFFAGALFPITAMPAPLAAIAKFLPLTHGLALMRYAFVDRSGKGLHDIWGMHSVATEAWLSLAVVAVSAVAFTVIAIRVFARAAVK